MNTSRFKEQCKLETGKDSLMNAIRATFYNPPIPTDEGINKFLTDNYTIQNVDVVVIGSQVSDQDGDLIVFRILSEPQKLINCEGQITVEMFSQKDSRRISGGIRATGSKTFVFYPNKIGKIKVENQEHFKLNVI